MGNISISMIIEIYVVFSCLHSISLYEYTILFHPLLHWGHFQFFPIITFPTHCETALQRLCTKLYSIIEYLPTVFPKLVITIEKLYLLVLLCNFKRQFFSLLVICISRSVNFLFMVLSAKVPSH